jgi:hypothetical protein
VGESKDLVSVRCLARISRWRVPANYNRTDWMRELRAVISCTAVIADREYNASCGVPRDAFLYERLLSAALTRYRQEWRFASRYRSESENHSAGQSLDSNPMQESVAHAVASLPKPDRDLITNLFWEGQTEAEIAARLKVTQQAISKRKAVILERLRRTLEFRTINPFTLGSPI